MKKQAFIIILCLTSFFFFSRADGILEGFEVDNQEPFGGTAQLTWAGDLSDFELTSSTWPYGSTVDFAGDHSLRSRNIGALNSTILTDISTSINFNYKIRWEVYVSGNSAAITNSRGFAFILFVNTGDVAAIENGSCNGYRLRLADPDGGDPDGLYLEKASGSGWGKIDEYITGSANINAGWNLAVERETDGAWTWGFANGAIGSTVTLAESIVDNDHTSGSYAGMYWYSTSTDANDFGFDNFSVDPYTPGLWKTTATTQSWNSSDNWDDEIIPTGSTNVEIPTGADQYPIIGSASALCNHLDIDPCAQLTINTGYILDVNGNFTIKSTSSGTGSFLNRGTLAMLMRGTTTYERHIEAYTGSEDGWHLLSSPTGDFTVAGSGFAPGIQDDLYRWDEPNNMWLNYKTEAFNMVSGKGYLVAYETTDTKDFTGAFPQEDISFSNLTQGAGNGWHLLGNPFPCPVKWNDGNWGLTNIESVAHVYNESAGNYTSLTSDDIIPGTQGFFVKATNPSNSITIPEASRTHDNTAFYTPWPYHDPMVVLQIGNDSLSFYDQTKIRINPNSSHDYDPDYDGHKITGQPSAPQFYSYSDDHEKLSVNTYPEYQGLTVPLCFDAGVEAWHQLTLSKITGFDTLSLISLEDLIMDSTFLLQQDSVYGFYAWPGDPPDRFLLHFEEFTDLPEINTAQTIRIFHTGHLICLESRNQEVAITKLLVCDLLGRRVFEQKISFCGSYSVPIRLPKGCYLARLLPHKEPVLKFVIK